MAERDIVVIGASAGGVEAVSDIVAELPADFPAAIFIVVHFPSEAESVLPAILNRRGRIPAAHPRDGEPIQFGRIYPAPSDRHLLVHNGKMRVVRGPQENGYRPAVDVLFRSAALAYGPRVIGIVLSGFLDDGTAGLMAVKRCGGIAIVQDPEDALASGMPSSAIQHVAVDYIVPVSEIPALLDRLVREPLPDALARDVPGETLAMHNPGPSPQRGAGLEPNGMPESEPSFESTLPFEDDAAELDVRAMHVLEGDPVPPADLACPKCGGTLWEFTENQHMRYRCRVGHAFTADSLLVHQANDVEDAFWMALRTLEESASLARRMLKRARDNGHRHVAARLERQVHEAEHRAQIVRDVLLSGAVELATNAAVTNDTTGR